MLKKLVFLAKTGLKLIRKDVVNKEDYRAEYDKVSRTYSKWLGEVSRYTDEIIMPLDTGKSYKILDFACGTGYITRKLLESDVDLKIVAVDYSKEMLSRLDDLTGDKLTTINSEGIEFLKNTDEKFDIIFFGWALSYFNHKELFPLFKKVLNEGGKLAIITNVEGTLSRIEDIFIKVMYKNESEVVKPMDIAFNLPKGSEGLEAWLKKYGFEKKRSGDGEIIVSFDTPEELLDWLNETGAAAGTGCIFKDYDRVKYDLVEEIKKEKCVNGKYEINHKFAYGIFEI